MGGEARGAKQKDTCIVNFLVPVVFPVQERETEQEVIQLGAHRVQDTQTLLQVLTVLGTVLSFSASVFLSGCRWSEIWLEWYGGRRAWCGQTPRQSPRHAGRTVCSVSGQWNRGSHARLSKKLIADFIRCSSNPCYQPFKPAVLPCRLLYDYLSD